MDSISNHSYENLIKDEMSEKNNENIKDNVEKEIVFTSKKFYMNIHIFISKLYIYHILTILASLYFEFLRDYEIKEKILIIFSLGYFMLISYLRKNNDFFSFLVKDLSPTSFIKYAFKIILLYIFIVNLIIKSNPFFNLFFFWMPFHFTLKFSLVKLSFDIYMDWKIPSDIFIFEIYNLIPYFKDICFFRRNKVSYLLICLILVLTKLLIFLWNDQFSYLNTSELKSYRYFIAANLYNNEDILKDWTNELKKLINYLGKENCLVSIVENGDSTDKTPIILENFKLELDLMAVKNRIITSKIIDKDSYERIIFMTLIRNKVLEFLDTINYLDTKKTIILFFNDIIFSYKDILKLIQTNEMNYDIACGLDFYESFYDTWVAFGVDGHPLRHYYPYFRNAIANDRVVSNQIVRVFSCWNGVISMKAEPFLKNNLSFRYPWKIRQSECILLNVDFWSLGYNRIFLNPEVKVAYTSYYYYMNKYVYPWTKNLFTYFYYYFVYFFETKDTNFARLYSDHIELPEDWLYLVNKYLRQ
jgi:hypothetical protein